MPCRKQKYFLVIKIKEHPLKIKHTQLVLMSRTECLIQTVYTIYFKELIVVETIKTIVYH